MACFLDCPNLTSEAYPVVFSGFSNQFLSSTIVEFFNLGLNRESFLLTSVIQAALQLLTSFSGNCGPTFFEAIEALHFQNIFFLNSWKIWKRQTLLTSKTQ